MQKVLVATSQGQGGRGNDFCWTDEGEVVYLGFECDRDRNRIDGGCGCRRSFAGTNSQMATTTARVAIISDEQMREVGDKLRAFYRDDWKANEVAAKSMTGQALYIHTCAQKWPEGTIVERRGRVLRKRESAE